MFNLIISIIAIALGVALSGASLYYGGEAFNRGSEDAKASTFINQAQQVQAAATLFAASEGGSAGQVQDLLDNGYMSTEPKLAAGSSEWEIDPATSIIYVTEDVTASARTGVTEGICDTINDNGAGVVKCVVHNTDLATTITGPEVDTDDGVSDVTVGTDQVTIFMAL